MFHLSEFSTAGFFEPFVYRRIYLIRYDITVYVVFSRIIYNNIIIQIQTKYIVLMYYIYIYIYIDIYI